MFNNFNDATVNGSQLGTTGVGMNQSLSGGMMPQNTAAGTMPGVTVASPTTPQIGGVGNPQMGSGFFSPQGGAGMILGGLQVLGNLWNTWQSHKMAKEQMSFAREQWDTNLANQTQTYNTALEDRIRGRYATGTRSEGQLQGEIDKHSL